MNFSKTLLTSGLLIAGAMLFATSTFAGTYGTTPCVPTYGNNECEKLNIEIEKKVADPISFETKGGTTTYTYIDNIQSGDVRKYVPGQTVPFQLVVTNTGSKTLTNIKVTDKLPDYITFVSGPAKASVDGKTIIITIDKLAAGESKTIEIVGQVASAGELPADQDTVCVFNQSFVEVNGLKDQDNAQVCIRKTSVGGKLPVHPAPVVKKTPPTGPEALALIPVLGGALSGLYLRRKTNNL